MMVTPNLVNGLEQITCFGVASPQPVPPPAVVPSFTMASPISYQFQVVEYTDVNDVVVKVELQVQQTTHDQYGNVKISSGFIPVPRIKLPLVV